MTTLATPIAAPMSHPMLAQPSPDGLARENFCRMLKKTISTKMSPLVLQRYEEVVEPAFVASHDRAPEDRHEIASVLDDDPYVQMWSAIRRHSQEMLTEVIVETVESELPSLMARAETFTAATDGEVIVPDEFEIPTYIGSVDIHCMPTGYYREYCEGDLAAGALYDRLVFAYTGGELGPLNDTKGTSLIENFLQVEHPDFVPKHILDMGCSVGHSTLPYVDAFPSADVTAIDIGAPMVRYAHARASAMGKRVRFMQANSEATGLPAESFDLIVSHIMFHETSAKALRNILAETYRLLEPGGLAVHQDYPLYESLPPTLQYMLDWDTHHNNEPFWGGVRDTDLLGVAREAGFSDPQYAYIPIGRKLQLGAPSSRNGQLLLLVLKK